MYDHTLQPPPGRARSSITLAQAMGWVFVLGSMFWPRLSILGFWIFSRDIGNAFAGWVVPALGFLLLPWTTLAYAVMWGVSSHGVYGVEWIVVTLALATDLFTYAVARGVSAA